MSVHEKCIEYCLKHSYDIPGWRTRQEGDEGAAYWESRVSVKDQGGFWLAEQVHPS